MKRCATNSTSSRASASRVVDALIAEANYRGGLDNITAIVIQITGIDPPPGADEPTDESITRCT